MAVGGGSGGYSQTSAGTGAGGYPAAGIGGGGAGAGSGGEQAGGGGYTGGNQEPDGLSDESLVYVPQVNGLTGLPQTITITRGVGGGYLQDLTSNTNLQSNSWYPLYGLIGGGAGLSFNTNKTPGGSGGVAGRGGIVNVASTARVYAFNGNRYTDKVTGHENPEYDKTLKQTVNGDNQCTIYAQNGIYLKVAYPLYNWNSEKNEYFSQILGKTINYIARTTACVSYSDLTTFREYSAKGCEFYQQGIGSGAGYLETSNGSYKIDGIEQMK